VQRRLPQRSSDRTNSRNGYRPRAWDTRAGTIDLAVPKLRSGSYFPDWLLERRRRAEAALISVVATSYLLGVSTRRMDKLVETLGHQLAVEVAGVRGWPPSSMSRSRRSAPDRWTPAPTPSSGPTR
jgi:transposase-like protein